MIKRTIKKFRERHYFRKMDYTPEILHAEEVKTVVIYQPEAVGDAMAFYPVLRSLEKAKVEHIILIVSPRNASIYEFFKPLHTKVTFHQIPHRFELNKQTIQQEAQRVRALYGCPDLCIEATRRNKIETAWFVGSLQAKSNLTLSSSNTMRCYSPLGRHAQDLSKQRKSLPLVWRELMVGAGFPSVPSKFEFPISAHTEQEVAEATRNLNDYIVLNLDGSKPERQISIENGINIVKSLYQVLGKSIIMVYAPDGETKARKLSTLFDFVHCMDLPPSLQRTVALVKYASLVVTPDTSVLHMASAYNTPVIGIYTRYNGQWRPLSDIYATIITNTNNINDMNQNQFGEATQKIHSLI